MEYTFLRSKRKTIAITVKQDGTVILRAPLGFSKKRAEEFLNEKRAWIEKSIGKMAERRAGEQNRPAPQQLSDAEVEMLKKQAKKVLPPMVAETAKEIGVTYGRISVRAQKTRWGSCSSKGNLNFNCMLMLLPENVQRYVVVHELCHRKEMNHSKAFWLEVEKHCPTYKKDRAELHEKGKGLLQNFY